METYKIRVVANIGARSEETFGIVGTEIEVIKGTFFDYVTDTDGENWIINGYTQLENCYNDDKYRTIFKAV